MLSIHFAFIHFFKLKVEKDTYARVPYGFTGMTMYT